MVDTRTMRVALITRHDSHVTGLRRYSDTLLHQMMTENFNVDVIHPVAPIPGLMARAGRHLGWDLATFFQTYPVRLRAPAADIYHLTSETLATLGVFSSIRPTVVTVHAFFSYLLRNEPALAMQGRLIDRGFDLLAARGLRRAHAVIAVSDYVRKSLVEEVGVSEERIHVIHEAVDHREFRPQPVPDSFYKAYRLRHHEKYVLYVGSEQPRKNFLMLLRAFARLRAQHEDVRLLKVGQAELQSERDKAVKLIEDLGIRDSVIFCGHVGGDLPLFYNLCHVFAFPSRYEGFGFPPLEAMACGAPVVCSNATSLPEVVGEAALLVDPSDEDMLVHWLDRLMSDEGLRQEYKQRALARAKRFDWATTARRTIDVYREVAAQPERIALHA